MKQGLKDLIEISRFYGSQKEFVIAGGGNTSFKTDKKLFVKASGRSLADIDEQGFVALDRNGLELISTKKYSDDALTREAQIKTDLLNCCDFESDFRPSVEAPLHHLIKFSYVVHTHSTKVNGLMCSNDAAQKTKELFPDALYISYVDPGYILSKEVEKNIQQYREEQGREPAVIFLQNHGVFVGAERIEDIKSIYRSIHYTLDAIYGETVATDTIENAADLTTILPALRMMLSGEAIKTLKLVNNKLLQEFCQDETGFDKIGRPFTPDSIVYANSVFIYVDFDGSIEELIGALSAKINDYQSQYKKFPKVIFIQKLGAVLVNDHPSGTDILEDLLNDICQISLYTTHFGGSSPMTNDQTFFIENWEAEHYRSQQSAAQTRGRVDRKIAIVTGGAQGFGAGIVKHLFKNGANVVVADLNEEKGEELVEALNNNGQKNRAHFIQTNVAEVVSVENLIHQTVSRFGGLDLFISNAGILRAGGLDEMTLETFELMTRVNYSAYFLCAKYASVVMKLQNQYKPDHFTDIIQINSKSGLKGSNKNFAYAGGKFGGIGLTQSFALELMPYKIKVNSICPGNFFDGPLWADPENGLFVQYLRAGKVPGAKSIEDVKKFYEAQVPAGRGCMPDDVMKAVYYAVEQQYETGQAIPVTGGQNMLS